MSPSDLSRAITEESWDQARKIVQMCPEKAGSWTKRDGLFDGKTAANVLPLHEALVGGAPFEVIKDLVFAYPKALTKKETSYDRLPLHISCRKHADPSVVQLLVNQYKDAALEPDSLNRLPIHYALTNGAEDCIIGILMKAAPESARGCDYKGWNPIFVALNVQASSHVVRELLEANPESVLMRTQRGTSIRGVIPKDSAYHNEMIRLVTEKKKEINQEVHLPSLKRNPLRASRMIMV